MNGVTYKMIELELASFLKARGHRLFSVTLDGNAVAFDFDGDTAPHVELRAPALTPERKSVLCLPAQHGAITANSFWGQGRSPWLLAVRVLKKGQSQRRDLEDFVIAGRVGGEKQ